MQVGEAKALHTTKRSSGIDVSDPSLAEAWASIRTDGEPQTNWCAFTYAEGSNSVIDLLGSGTGGVPELCSILLDSMVAFCGVRVGDDKGSARFHRILFVGEEVGGMKKGRAALAKNAVFAVFEGASGGDHDFSSVDDLSAASVFQ
ncbi:unnamed protein product [Ectocarpus sp. 12 AP-2014]